VSRSENPVTLGEWHTVHASRTGRLGQLTLDAQSTSMEGISPGRFTQLTLSSRLFVGGSSNWKHVFHSAGVNRSFHGCVQLVSITIPLLSHRYCSRYISIVTAANEAVFSLAFVCSLADCAKTSQLIFTKFGRKAAHEPWKKRLDFGGNPDHITL